MTARWEQMEDHITTYGLDGTSFSVRDFAVTVGVPVREATSLTQAYLGRINRKGDTLYGLRRTGRTRATIWHVGTQAEDKEGLTEQACDDQRVRLAKNVAGLKTMGRLNPSIDPGVQVSVAAMEFTQNQLEYLLSK